MNLRLVFLLSIVFGGGFVSIRAQRCGTYGVNQNLEKLFPQMKSEGEKVNEEVRKMGMQRYLRKLGVKGISDLRSSGAYAGPIYEIPVVVHVIESGAAARANLALTDDQIKTWIENCNRMFATTYGNGYYAEGGGTEGGAVMPFRLVLAKRNPQCQSTTGIIRYDGSTIPNYDSKGVNSENSDGVTTDQIRALAPHWQEQAYYNIYVVTGFDSNFEAWGLMGWATYPQTPWARYETMMKAAVVTKADDNTLAHELGHAFGLKHTFDDENPYTCPTETDCATDGDMVCDTELSTSHLNTAVLPTNTEVNPCTGQPYQGVQHNIMNYTRAPRKFTPGQREKALAEFLTHKGALIKSKAHLPIADALALNVLPAQCVPTGLDDLDNYQVGISRVILKDIDYSSDVVNKSNPNFYSDYTTKTCILPVYTDLKKEVEHTLTVHKLAVNPVIFTVWIDYNGDGTFSADEQVGKKIGQKDETSVEIRFTPPANALEDSYLRLRVRGDYVSSDRGPCENLYLGEIEDYVVRIVCPQTVNESEVETILAGEGFVGGYTTEQLATLTSLYATYQADRTNCNAKVNVANEVTRLTSETKIPFEATKYYRLYTVSDGHVLYVDYANNRVASRTLSDANKVDEFWKLSSLDGAAQIMNPNTQTGISSADGNLATGVNALLANTGMAKYSIKFGDSPLTIAPEFRLKAIESINLPVSKKYATFCYPFAVEPRDASSVIYTVNNVSGQEATVNTINGIIPANTPVIVRGEDNSVHTMNIVYDNSQPVATIGNNLLRGVSAPTNISQSAFVIWTNSANETGFYPVAQAGLLSANKAYLLLPNAGGAYYKINISDATTKIMDIKEASLGQTQYYDLSGKPVRILLPGVVYLTSEGKKVIFKQ